MAQVNMNAWQQGSQMYRDSLDRERQAKIDDMQAKRFGWEEENVRRESDAYNKTQEIGARGRTMFEAQPDSQPGAYAGASTGSGADGAVTQDAVSQPPASARNPTLSNPVTSDAANPMMNNLAQGIKEGTDLLRQQRQAALNAYDMALANGDRQGMMVATEAVQKITRASQRANIFSSVLSNPETISALAANITNNPAMPLKAVTDKNGITVLQRDDGSPAGKLRPDQMAMIAVHMDDIKNGDVEGGRKGIAGISKELSDAIDVMNNQTGVLANSANNAVSMGSKLNVDRANVAQSYAAAANSGSAARERVAERDAARKEAEEKRAAGMALFKEQNPDATPAQMAAAGAGVIPFVQAKNSGGYKTEAGDVTSLLGTPAVDRNGRPVVDPMTGRQIVNRDPNREQALFQFMRANGIRDTNEGLQRFMQEGGGAAPSASAAPAAAIEMLKKNPALAAQFDQKYGAGAASRALGK